MVEGYIVISGDFQTLTENLFWYRRNHMDNGLGFVFSTAQIIEIGNMCSEWFIKPKYVREATFDPQTGETKLVTGKYLDFEDVINSENN